MNFQFLVDGVLEIMFFELFWYSKRHPHELSILCGWILGVKFLCVCDKKYRLMNFQFRVGSVLGIHIFDFFW